MTVLPLLPNAITLSRIALVPVFILLAKDQDYLPALLVFGVAGVSDGLDGFIARHYNLRTRLGAILDPVADKTLLVSAYVMLSFLGHLPFWLVLSVVFRDVLIVGGYIVYTLAFGSVRMQPSLLSKANTFMQVLLVVAVLVQLAHVLPLAPWLDFLIYMTLGTTIASGVHYLWSWGVMRRVEAEEGSDKP